MLKWKEKIIFFLLIGCLVIPGCKKEAEEIREETGEVPKVEINTDKEKEESEDSKPEEQETGRIYYIDYNSGEMLEGKVDVEKLDADTIWKKLQEKEMVPAESSVLNFVQNGDALELDLDSNFGNYIRRQGTSGEYEIIRCVVNTYLDSFSAQKIKITEEGQVFESSHSIYDNYFEKTE